MRERARGKAPVVVAVLALGLGTCAPAHASAGAQAIGLRVELLEQAACLAGPDEYRVSFELRTTYTNTGRLAVKADVSGAIVAGASFLLAGAEGEAASAPVTFGMPADSDGLVALPADAVVLDPGSSVSGRRTTVWVPLWTWGGTAHEALVPGSYEARFELRLPVESRDRTAYGIGGGVLLPLTSQPMTIQVAAPTQVQECGSFSLPLLPSP